MEDREQQQDVHTVAALLSLFREPNPWRCIALLGGAIVEYIPVGRPEGDEAERGSPPSWGCFCFTVDTLQVLGLTIQQCVVSCFNDFAIHTLLF
jgi:hypothetical protein